MLFAMGSKTHFAPESKVSVLTDEWMLDAQAVKAAISNPASSVFQCVIVKVLKIMPIAQGDGVRGSGTRADTSATLQLKFYVILAKN